MIRSATGRSAAGVGAGETRSPIVSIGTWDGVCYWVIIQAGRVSVWLVNYPI